MTQVVELQNFKSLQWRHNGRDCVSNHQPHDRLLNRLFRRRSKKTSKLRVSGLCAGNSPGTGEFPAQMASNAENVSISWRQHVFPNFIYVSHKDDYRHEFVKITIHKCMYLLKICFSSWFSPWYYRESTFILTCRNLIGKAARDFSLWFPCVCKTNKTIHIFVSMMHSWSAVK